MDQKFSTFRSARQPVPRSLAWASPHVTLLQPLRWRGRRLLGLSLIWAPLFPRKPWLSIRRKMERRTFQAKVETFMARISKEAFKKILFGLLFGSCLFFHREFTFVYFIRSQRGFPSSFDCKRSGSRCREQNEERHTNTAFEYRVDVYRSIFIECRSIVGTTRDGSTTRRQLCH